MNPGEMLSGKFTLPSVLSIGESTLYRRDPERAPNRYLGLRGVAYGNGRFVVVGDGGVVLTSP